MIILLLWIAKIVQFTVRKIGHGGAALPGLLIEKVSKKFLRYFLNKIQDGVIVVSGTNGKTTTTKILVEVLEKQGQRVFTNRSGSNMTRGLISAVISHASIFGRMPYDIAILEVDEAYGPKFSELVTVRGVVVLNVMRDQLDRFGEIDTTTNMLSALTNAATDFVILNASDKRVKLMPSSSGVKRVLFGLTGELKNDFISDDDWHRDISDNKTDKADYVLLKSSNYNCTIESDSKKYNLENEISGVHNHLNLLAAIACLDELKINEDQDELLKQVQSVKPAFGRGEKIDIGNCHLTLQLIKNPGSFMQNIKSITLSKYDYITIVINDSYADSRDVSWLWDVDFSSFKGLSSDLYLGGTRAYDLAVRLKHEGVSYNHIENNIPNMTSKIVKQDGQHIVFCTYTAMLSIRKVLIRRGHASKVL